MATPPRILITGASGFIGQFLLQKALDQGWEVWAAVHKTTQKGLLSDPRVKTIRLDYSSSDSIRTMVDAMAPQREPMWHYVIHNAGVTKCLHSQDFWEVNSQNTRYLAEGLAQAAYPPMRFLLISSLATFGAPTAPDGLLYPESPSHPTSIYGKSKLLGEKALERTDLPYSILSLTGVYGPGDEDYLWALRSIQKGINIQIGRKSQRISFIYVEDVARAAFFLLSNPQAPQRKFLLTDGYTYSGRDFALIAQEILHKKHLMHIRIPLPIAFMACQIGDFCNRIFRRATPINKDKYNILSQTSWIADNSALRSLGFIPQFQLREGLEKTIRHAQEHGLL